MGILPYIAKNTYIFAPQSSFITNFEAADIKPFLPDHHAKCANCAKCFYRYLILILYNKVSKARSKVIIKLVNGFQSASFMIIAVSSNSFTTLPMCCLVLFLVFLCSLARAAPARSLYRSTVALCSHPLLRVAIIPLLLLSPSDSVYFDSRRCLNSYRNSTMAFSTFYARLQLPCIHRGKKDIQIAKLSFINEYHLASTTQETFTT